jgi:hypothetical protein
MTSTSPKHAPAWIYAAFLAVCEALAFYTHFSDLHAGYKQDDYLLVRTGPLTPAIFVNAFNPYYIHSFYRPIFVLWFRFLNTVAPHNPVDMHAGSIILFGLTLFLMGIFVYRLTQSAWTAVAATYLFLTAPDMSEAVNWISASSTLLASVFSLLTLLLWMKARETGSRRAFAASVVTLILAMCSKEDAASLPFIVAVFDLYLNARLGKTHPGSFLTAPPEAGRVGGLLPVNARFLRAWWPLIIWTPIYLILDITRYRLNAAEGSSGRVWHGWHHINWGHVIQFAQQPMFVRTFSYPPAYSTSIGLLTVLLAVAFALFLIRVRKNPLVLAMTFMALLASLPAPLASGGHAAVDSRFSFIPNLYGVMLACTLVFSAVTSRRRFVHAAGVALMISIVTRKFPMHWDIAVDWVILAATALAAYVVIRTGKAPLWTSLFVGVTAVAIFITQVVGVDWGGAVLCLAVVLGGIYGARAYKDEPDVWDGMITGYILMGAVPLSLPVFLAEQVFNKRE